MKALIVDDSKITLQLISKMLKKHCGFEEIITLQEPNDVISEITNDTNSFDLVILDWQMPSLSGIEILEGMRSNGYEMPIIMCTSDGNKEHILEAIEKGANEYIVKPIALEEFSTKVHKVMKGYWEWLLKREESKSVLVVDDQKVNRDLIIKMLSKNEKISHIEIAENGHEAIGKYKEINYDLVILDFEMPHLNGLEVTQTIRRYDQHTPILMVSSHTDQDFKLEAFNKGITHFSSKPLVLNDFLYTVHQMVAISHQPQS